MKPDISVIMSVYNGEDYLEEAVQSVIDQTFKNWELIIINDCSTDTTEEILDTFSKKDERIKVYKNEVNLKLPASLNRAVSLASGKYIARMDADDICLPERLEKQYAFMEAHSDTALSSCRFLTVKNGIYMSGGMGGRCDADAIRAMLLAVNPILHPGVIAKAEIFRKYPYDTSLTCTEDLELWTRLAAAGEKLEIFPECLLIYRLHDKQITSTTFARQCTEVLRIEQKYYEAFSIKMKDELYDFYIHGIYFRNNSDINKFIEYAKWLRGAAGVHFDRDALNYALFETLAEYKRRGMEKKAVLKGMLAFCPFFLIREMYRRKKSASKDLQKCMKVAEQLELCQIGGKKEFPIYKKR